MSLFSELYSPNAIAAYWEENPSNREPYMGEAFFPAQRQMGLDLKWIKASHGLPISLMPTAYDAQPTFRDREGLTVTETEMPFFREGFRMKEKDRKELLRIKSENDPYLGPIIDRLLDDASNLIEGARVVAERERMQLLFPVDGDIKIVFKANGINYTYDYDAPPNGSTTRPWKSTNYFALTGDALWTATSTADPFSDFTTAQTAVSGRTGSTPTIAVMNRNTFNLLLKMDAVKNQRIYAGGIVSGFMTEGELKSIIQSTVGVDIRIYDKQYKDESGTVQKFVPDGYVAMLPAGRVGTTYYAPTPEESDLMAGATTADTVSIVDTGIAIHHKVEAGPPVELSVYASEVVLPSYEGMDEVALLKVAA